MKGVVVIPNSRTGCAVIQRDDDFIMVVELLDGGQLGFLDVVELGDIKADSKMSLKNRTSEAIVEVNVLRIDSDLTWEEKMALWGKKVR